MLTGLVISDRDLGASGDTHPAWMMAHAVAGPYLVMGASAVGQIHRAQRLPLLRFGTIMKGWRRRATAHNCPTGLGLG